MSLATIVTVGIMILGFVGMIVSAKIQNKLLAVVCLAVVLGCAVKFMIDQGAFGGPTREEQEQLASMKRFQSSIAKKLGDTYAAQYKGKKVVVVAPNGEDFNKPENKEGMVFPNEIKEAFVGANVTIKGLPYKNSNTPDAIEQSMNPKYLEKFLNDNDNVDLIVLTVPLPPDPSMIAKLSIWNKGKAPKLIITNAMTCKFVGWAISKDKILCITIARPDLKVQDYEKLAPTDLKEAFDARYLLIDKKNLGAISKQFKDLFAR